MVAESKPPQMTAGRAVLVGLMRRYLSGVMEPWVTLLEIHKLMYFMQEAGEPLKLKFAKAHYGPYAENLRHVLSKTEGHFTLGFGDGPDEPTKPIEVTEAGVEQAERFLQESGSTVRNFERVAELIEGFETPYGMELLATVHWVARHEHATSPAEAVERIHAWNDRKKMFGEQHVELAWNVLERNGWLAAEA